MKKIAIAALSTLLFSASTLARPPEDSVEIMQHLEFSGYTVTSNTSRLEADHDEYLNILMKDYRNGILTIAYFVTNENGKQNKAEMLELLNALNSQAAGARYYLDSDGDIVIEAYYPGSYDRTRFASFLDVFHLEKDNLSNHYSELKQYLN